MESSEIERLARLKDLLGGSQRLDLATHLVCALDDGKVDTVDEPFAIGIDANVLLNMGKGRAGADIVDYLGSRHQGPVIVPSQVLIEFWNNYMGGVEGLGGKLKKHFSALGDTLKELDPSYSDFSQRAEVLVRDFEERYGHVLQGRVAEELRTLFRTLCSSALFPQVDRPSLMEVAQARRTTRTPPGFKDSEFGDFFVWSEFLVGLDMAREFQMGFSHCVLVTDDGKSDWSTNGTPHPSLCAEMQAWADVPFTIWNLDRLKRHVEDWQKVESHDHEGEVTHDA
ncbi:PIN-like domain-containing protein [Thioalkalivibrio sp. ALJ16]|uniref:PIN-like domain-containing protein n=1 Tax=Thioalkalivibrio sp. ALJ16 TaxID=1158762 RepID=UPI0012DC88BB|nr:PIN-like domain-containing protein [Thioalkalivibrio sp. ALJ16]